MRSTITRYLYLSIFLSFSLSMQSQFVNFEDTWKEFLANNKISNISEMPKPKKNQPIDYLRYCLMVANTHFCSGDIPDAEIQMAEVKKMGAASYKTIQGYKEKYDDLAVKIKAYHQVERLWKEFLKTRDISLSRLEAVDAAKKVCEKGTLAKYFYMEAHAHYCLAEIAEAKSDFEGRVLKLAEKTSLKVSDIIGLEEEVKMMKVLFINLPKLGKAWKQFIDSGESAGFTLEIPEVECYSIPSMKSYVLQGAADLCGKGDEMLKKIKALQKNNTHTLNKILVEKIEWLETEVEKNNEVIANLNKAWKEFMPIDTLTSGIEFGFDYCSEEAVIRAFIMQGTIYSCEKGDVMIEEITKIQKEFKPKLQKNTLSKIEKLKAKVEGQKDDFENLNIIWKEFVANDDTLTESFILARYYCDKIAQIKSWTIKGHMNSCKKGQWYLDHIDKLQKLESLEYDDELACRVKRLRIKVWDCRYWELVMQARKETHEERERFGPASAGIMSIDLNSDKQPCETGVKYTPLGNIGIKYIISTYLCQDIDLAKMGDPEYYKKIATWVDTEVLAKYCEKDLRCKEDFFIYLEGHTDGNPFRGARYKKSLDIPEGTAFTHFLGDEIMEKETENEITKTLKSNMHLGIARAWTVKQQLDFMEVPITIGAWEHPKSEKGGEYRKIEIELNITNLLLDFYEKRLMELLEESGIGVRPEEC
jgi:hypothetical protein